MLCEYERNPPSNKKIIAKLRLLLKFYAIFINQGQGHLRSRSPVMSSMMLCECERNCQIIRKLFKFYAIFINQGQGHLRPRSSAMSSKKLFYANNDVV